MPTSTCKEIVLILSAAIGLCFAIGAGFGMFATPTKPQLTLEEIAQRTLNNNRFYFIEKCTAFNPDSYDKCVEASMKIYK